MNICRILVRQCHTDIAWFLQSAGEDLNPCKENSISKVVLPSLSWSPVGTQCHLIEQRGQKGAV